MAKRKRLEGAAERWAGDAESVWTGMADWREAVFAFMSRNASNIADFLRLPSNCVIELGTRIQI